MTLKEAAALLGTTPDNLRGAIRRGSLKAAKHGRDWWVDPKEVERYRLEHRRGEKQMTKWQKYGSGNEVEYLAVVDGVQVASVYRGGVASYPWSTTTKLGKAHPTSTLASAKEQVERLVGAK